MKLISFTVSGHSSYGVVVGDRIVDLGRRLGDRYPTLRTAIAGGALAGAGAEVDSAATDMALSQVTPLPPITDPDKIICAGRNYRAHTAEAGGAPPENPSVFLRLVNTLVAHNQPIVSAPGGTATKIRMLALEGVHDAPPPPAQLSFGFRAAMPPGTAGD